MPRQNYLFTSESVSEGHPDKVCDRVSDTVVDAYLARDAGGARRLRDARHHEPGRDRRRGARPRLHHPRPYRRHDPGGDPGHRLRAGRFSLAEGRHRRPPPRPVGRHRPRGGRRRQQGRGRGRPGHHVRLRHGRDPGPDAGPDLLRPQDPRGPDARPQIQAQRRRRARPRRQEPGHPALRERPPGRGDPDRALHPAPGRDPRIRRRPGHRRALHPQHPPGRAGSTRAPSGTSTRPASS